MDDYKSLISDIVGQYVSEYLKRLKGSPRAWHYNAIAKETAYPLHKDDNSGNDYSKLFYWDQEFFPNNQKNGEFASFVMEIIYANADLWKTTIDKEL